MDHRTTKAILGKMIEAEISDIRLDENRKGNNAYVIVLKDGREIRLCNYKELKFQTQFLDRVADSIWVHAAPVDKQIWTQLVKGMLDIVRANQHQKTHAEG